MIYLHKPSVAFCIFLSLIAGCSATVDSKEVNVQSMTPGEFWTVPTDAIPIWIIYRTPEEISVLSVINKPISDKPPFNNAFRSIRPELFVVYGNCPGSTELLRNDRGKGFTCLATGISYDLSGRPVDGNTASASLSLPNYTFKNAVTLVIPNSQ